MPESNPLIEAIRRLATMIAAKPDVSLGRADPDSPAPSPRGVVLTVGRQRVALTAPISDTGWQPLTLMSGFTGGAGDHAPQWRVRDGWAMLRGRVTRTAGNWTGAATEFAVTPVEALPTRLLYTVAVARGGHVLTAAINIRLQIMSAAATAEVHLESIPPWRVD